MKYPASIFSLIQSVIDGMDFTVEITGVSTNDDGYVVLTVCDSIHAQAGYEITLFGDPIEDVPQEKTCTIISATENQIVISGITTITSTSFELQKPFFFHGTPRGTQEEIGKINNSFNKFPMFWLLETPLREVYHNNVMDYSNYERSVDCSIFVLTGIEHQKNLTDGNYTEGVDPMKRLAFHFLNEIKKAGSPFIQTDKEGFNLDEKIDHYTKYGVYISNSGTEKNLFVDKLSGVGLPLNLQVKRGVSERCVDNCN